MKTKYFIFAAMATIMFASCTSEDFVGNTEAQQSVNESQSVINFSGGADRITRATSNTGTVAQMLDGQFKIYGVKKVNDSYTNVFVNYAVWNSNTKTTSNPDGGTTEGSRTQEENGWEYVGDAGSHFSGFGTQTIKYWDYSATNYHFVAGSPVASFTYNLTSGDITSATVTGLAGHITANLTSGSGTALNTDPVYIADPVNVAKVDYNKEVTFSFTRMQTFVRVGVYETIPGYHISSINFYEHDASGWKTTPNSAGNIILASTEADYFRGANAENGKATVTYNWSTLKYSYELTGLTEARNWFGGQLSDPLATNSTDAVAKLYGTDKDMGETGYFAVIPSKEDLDVKPILIKCDYVLTSDDTSGETITVKGATAAIPAAFTKWNPNTSYTYLFKISPNSNGSTGDPSHTDPDPENPETPALYPITFDAVVVAEAAGTEQGTITTVTTPSITTYQSGSVTTAGVQYKTGKPIYATVADQSDGTLKSLSISSLYVGQTKIFSLGTTAKTEADLELTAPTVEVTTATVVSSATTVDNVTIPANQAVTFTPSAAGYYAVRYQTTNATGTTPAAYTYKVIHVVE